MKPSHQLFHPECDRQVALEFIPTFWETPLQSQWEFKSLPECNSLIIVK